MKMTDRGTGESFRNKKEIEEARKNGTLPPEQDEDGNLINPHIPEFMAKTPWYLSQDQQPSLKHQKSTRQQKEKTFEEKRDPYKNWDPSEYKLTVERFNKLENERKKVKAQQREQELARKRKEKEEKRKQKEEQKGQTQEEGDEEKKEKSDSESSDFGSDTDTDLGSSDEDDDVRQSESHEAVDEGVMRWNQKAKMSVRNLRLREDTAKYLVNLDVNSAYYDPKTRSMRADPLPHVPATEKVYQGDNAWKNSADTKGLAGIQSFAWDAYNQGKDVHLQTNPTEVELMRKQYKDKKKKLEELKKQKLLDKYGGEEHLQAPPKELLYGQTEGYVEYSKDGRVIKGEEDTIPSSRHEEDVFPSNHSSVFGSWFDTSTMKWGYRCCHQTVMNTYCTGESGKRARDLATMRVQNQANSSSASSSGQDRGESLAEQRAKAIARGEKIERTQQGYKPDNRDEGDMFTRSAADPAGKINYQTLTYELQRAKEERKKNPDGSIRLGTEDQSDPTPEQREAEQLMQIHKDDPMAGYFKGKDEEESNTGNATEKNGNTSGHRKRGRSDDDENTGNESDGTNSSTGSGTKKSRRKSSHKRSKSSHKKKRKSSEKKKRKSSSKRKKKDIRSKKRDSDSDDGSSSDE